MFHFNWQNLPIEFKKRLVKIPVAAHVLRHVIKKYPLE